VCPGGLVGTIRQFNADGSPGWIWCDSVGVGLPTILKRTPDGQFVIAARSLFGSMQGYVRIDAAGQTVWSLAGILSPTVGDIAGDSEGNSYIVSANPDTGQGTRLRKLSPSGATLWDRLHPMSAFRVEIGPDGAPVMSGFPNTGSGGATFAKFSASGDLLWTNPDASGVGLLLHSAMLIDAAGSAYLSGSTLMEMGVAKVNADGSPAWSKLVPGGSSAGMALGQSNQVYLTGGIYTARIDQLADPIFGSGFE
jgi:outer membrane protein assembly factor BamB